MVRWIRWGVAAVCIAGIAMIIGAGLRSFGGLSLGLIGCVFLAVVMALMLAPYTTGAFANFFIDGIMGGTAPSVKPPPRTHAVARALRMQGRYGEAIEEYQRVLEASPKDAEAQRAIADICADKLGSYERAVQEFTKLLAMDLAPGEKAAVLNRLADLYDQFLGAPAFAATCLDEIRTRFPGTVMANNAAERLARLAESHPELGRRAT